jgi:hypothetical protein
MEMKTYPYQTPEGIIELVEKREYDKLQNLLKSEKSTRNAIIKKGVEMEQAAKQELQDAVKRMESIPVEELDKIWDTTGDCALDGIEGVRARLISAAKGES